VSPCPVGSVFVNGFRQLFPGIDILSEETDPEPAAITLSALQVGGMMIVGGR
jgi:hypothetical protein